MRQSEADREREFLGHQVCALWVRAAPPLVSYLPFTCSHSSFKTGLEAWSPVSCVCSWQIRSHYWSTWGPLFFVGFVNLFPFYSYSSHKPSHNMDGVCVILCHFHLHHWCLLSPFLTFQPLFLFFLDISMIFMFTWGVTFWLCECI